MQIFSFVRRGIDLEPIEVEITLVPGLPAFRLIGLPDAALKESILRIKSALRHQGFDLPKRDQVLINLKPTFEKKSSQGLDLAIAMAYLAATEQIDISQLQAVCGEKLYFYGELSLSGEVLAPTDIELLDSRSPRPVITGMGAKGLPVAHGQISALNLWADVVWKDPFFQPIAREVLGRDFTKFKISQPIADLLTVCAVGEHSIFLAGPAGTGKTTFSEMLHGLLKPPTPDEWAQIEKINRLFKSETAGRPLVSPHHSATEIALLGGGVPPKPGEITRAHRGLLVLDEYLEFDLRVKESLREPIERHEITVSRAGAQVTFPADFLLMATTNLCPCGEYVPGLPSPCGYNSTYCMSYYRRLSGPMLDRFDLLAFSHAWKSKTNVPWAEIKVRVAAAQEFALCSRGQSKVNSRLTAYECEETLPPFVRENLLPELPSSFRRRLALLRVARTYADLAGASDVEGVHIDQASRLTLQPFRAMKEAWS